MSKAILCAVDLGHPEISQAVLIRAQALAALDASTLNVITVVPDYGMSIVGSFFEEGTLKKAVKATTEQLHAFVSENVTAGTKVRHIVSVGSIYEEVLDAIGKTKADLVIMGAGKPGLKEYLLGPNASRIARHSNVSVYIVRDEAVG